jgi:hypothetical protein
LVSAGDSVEAHQAVAETTEPPDFRIVNVARELGVPPKQAAQLLQVEVGEQVDEGDVLASRGGWGGRATRAPFSGTVTGYGRGRLLLETRPRRIQLRALVPGTVVSVRPNWGVTLEARGAFIQAAWGNDREGYGVLKMAVRAARQILRTKRLDASMHGSIVVGGATLDEDVLDTAVELQIRGLVVGGVPPALIPRALEADFPILATEGIGKIPMSDVTFKLLRSLDGREVAVSGRLRTHWGAMRPYIVVPITSGSGEAINPEAPLSVGSQVRALQPPYQGMSGKVVALVRHPTLLQTGARIEGARVDFDGEVAFVPRVNLEQIL